jgi:hypothetical protein
MFQLDQVKQARGVYPAPVEDRPLWRTCTVRPLNTDSADLCMSRDGCTIDRRSSFVERAAEDGGLDPACGILAP